MGVFRRVLGAALVVIGMYYTARGAITLLNLPAVTDRWIALSGDIDFRSDFQSFQLMIGTGAAMVTLLGLVTVFGGLRTFLGRPVRWGAIAVAAPFLHVPWLMYRAIGTGAPVLPALERSPGLRVFATRCVVVCVAYILAWALTRYQSLRPAAE